MNDSNETVDPTSDAPKSAVVSPASHEMPHTIGRYRIERVLGRGGFGLVYLAHDDQLQRLVAIKVPHARLVAQTTNAEAYLTEARAVANLDHPNIVPVHDVGSNDRFPCYVVSKYIDGTDLATRLTQSALSLHEVVELVATVAEALHYAHKQGLVHRDIKPANILLDKSGKPFVGDFGVALREKDVGKGPRYAGTPAYMSPEQARGEGHRVDGRSDIFSLGVVFYELMVGRQPFNADSQHELLEQITSVDARPPRQLRDKIPKELDRICLKALSRRASERYSAARDMAEDLQHFLAESPSAAKSPIAQQQRGETDFASAVPAPTTPPASDSQPIKIVPKGLQSFDAGDADFFLELLPGPRNRDGLPDSIRFWKTRIETTDQESTFSVGLIYGPSGCGKSSLVKAGLLPRLAKSVMAVYVEATAQETEARLLKGLRRHLPDLPGNLGLIESLAAMRQGQFLESGQKVLLVLDQLEQWLHGKRNQEKTELVQALRQCDGGRLQCVVLVRDDFGMAATRFMAALDIPILQGNNFATVDLFDLLHARKVLAAFGRAYGRLPENLGHMTKDQDAFLDQAIAGLAQEGKVISVRLALFAEMVKGKPWTPDTLKEVGGTEGVGVTFLDETFTASTAPPQHRLHQKAAQAVLRALLPEAGTDIKGHMKSQTELLEASGYANRLKDFDDLTTILDGAVRLITPTDPEGKDAAAPSTVQAGAKYYHLTHDYLVPSLRDWLTRKQKETRRGRAELLLADRAGVWNARKENRQLPSLLQWLQIKWFTRKKSWTPPEQKLMGNAGRYHGLRVATVAALLAVTAFMGLTIYEQVVEQRKATQAAGLVQRLLDAQTAQAPAIIAEMSAFRQWVDPPLREEHGKAAVASRQKLHTSLALLPVDSSQVTYLYWRLLAAQPLEVQVIRDALMPFRDALRDKLWTAVEAPEKGKESQRLRAAAVLAKYDPQSEKWAKCSPLVVYDLVQENPIFLGQWSEAFRPVSQRLLVPLSAIFRDRRPDRTGDRNLATNLLADFAADDPQVLVNLLMDADEKQFASIYPLVEKRSAQCISALVAAIDRHVVIAEDKFVFESQEVIADYDAKVKWSQGEAMPAKRFEVRLQCGKTYRLTMDSKELDSFLVLQDKRGKELAFDDDSGGNQNSLLLYTAPTEDTYAVFAASFKGTGSFQLKIVETFAGDEAKEDLAKRQANAAVALLRMNQPAKVWPLLKNSPDPRARSYLIHCLSPLGAQAEILIHRLDNEPDIAIRRALLLALGEYGEKELTLDGRQILLPRLQEIYHTASDPGLHASAEWLLRTWMHQSWLKQANEDWAKDREQRLDRIQQLLTKKHEKTPPQWYVNGQGQTMVVIPGPVEFMMGSPPTEAGRHPYEQQHKERIGRTFALAATSVTLEQYQKFEKGFHLPAVYTRMANLPAVGIDWNRGAKYCNWLSKEEGLDETQWCYDIKGDVIDLRPSYLSLSGYRLPTEAEMEYATRAGAVTSRYYGETDDLLPKYAWYQKNSEERTWPVGSLKPNDFGLFDVQGNVFTWCQESYRAYPQGDEASEDKEDDLVIVSTRRRVLRGGSFNDLASVVRSANRYASVPTNQGNSVGFRLARTLPNSDSRANQGRRQKIQ